MKCFAGLAATVWLVATAFSADAPRLLEKAPVLPLALDDHFQFRKTEQFLNDPKYLKPTTDPMLQFERQRVNYGAVTAVDKLERRGHYFVFFWRATQPADLILRFEYRQENLGGAVQARDVHYEHAKGSMKTNFEIVGDDYLEDGRITAWRALLIEDGRIVGLTQSHLWN